MELSRGRRDRERERKRKERRKRGGGQIYRQKGEKMENGRRQYGEIEEMKGLGDVLGNGAAEKRNLKR